MALINKIESIVKAVIPTGTFILSSSFHANDSAFNIDSCSLPLVVLNNELKKDGEIKLNATLQNDTRIVLMFLDGDDPYKTDVEREAIRQNMEDLALRVVVGIYKLPEVKPKNDKQTFIIEPVFHYFVGDLTGVSIDMKINESVIINWCDE